MWPHCADVTTAEKNGHSVTVSVPCHMRSPLLFLYLSLFLVLFLSLSALLLLKSEGLVWGRPAPAPAPEGPGTRFRLRLCLDAWVPPPSGQLGTPHRTLQLHVAVCCPELDCSRTLSCEVTTFSELLLTRSTFSLLSSRSATINNISSQVYQDCFAKKCTFKRSPDNKNGLKRTTTIQSKPFKSFRVLYWEKKNKKQV